MPQQVGLDGSVIVGAKRSMTNPVINRNHFILGKSLSSLSKEAACTHGTLIKRDEETASSLMYHWTAPSPPRREIDHGRNFMKLNKMALSAGASDAHQVAQFRQTSDARIVSRPGDVLRLKNQVPVSMDPERVYGAATIDPGCTMTGLMGYSYEDEWVQEQLDKERKQQKKEELRASLRNTRKLRADKREPDQISLPSITSKHATVGSN